MRWRGRPGSGNILDMRGGRGIKLGCGSLILIIIVLLLGGNPMQLLQQMGGTGEPNTEYVGSAEEEEAAQFVSVVLKDTEDIWDRIFREQLNREYVKPELVLFTGYVQSACGSAGAATGPFYCPADQRVYIDLSFYEELRSRFGAPGDFAMAYVIAHEVGHHVQNLLGVTDQLDAQSGRLSQQEFNELSVRLELQADFLAGVFAHYEQTKGILEEGDIEEALTAANAIGDDRLQMQSQGYIVPESFTHGTSAQRMRWFRQGYETGDVTQGNTFDEQSL